MTHSQGRSTPSLDEQIAQLEAAMAAHDALRPTLGDDVVDTTLAPLRARLNALRAQAYSSTNLDAVSIEAQLSQLSQADLIRLFATEPDLAYIFKHALTQDAAYQSMLHMERRAVHRRVAQAFEQLYAD